MLHIFNTLSRSQEEFIPNTSGRVSFYTCGPTVYNTAHIGNFRAYVSADVLRRWLVHGEGYEVQWVLNITDVDDKTIRDSQKKYPSMPPKEALQMFTREYEDLFFDDLQEMGIEKDVFFATPRATEHISHIQNLIRHIHKNGFAKVVEGSVFFDLRKWSTQKKYGKLIDINLDQLQTGTRTLSDEIKKEDVADFVLWKAEKEGEPAWNFDFYGQQLPGRPGWHIECSAMENEVFDLPFDIHSGGVDLMFPHHEDEIAQSAAGYGVEPTKYWVHNEHLMVNGKKMSKSLGNFYLLKDIQEKGFSAEVLRFFFATHHYRSKLNMTDDGLSSAQTVLQKIQKYTRFFTEENIDTSSDTTSAVTQHVHEKKTDFINAMCDDLNMPVAIATVHALMNAVPVATLDTTSSTEKNALREFFLFVESVLGVSLFPTHQEGDIPQLVLDLIQQRKDARQKQDWKQSDSLREEIASHGFLVQDSGESMIVTPQ